jgi:mono/diheme cytochrome c family protein
VNPRLFFPVALLHAVLASGCEGERGAARRAREATVRFETYCAACHRLDGAGVEGGGPPLAGSPWLQDPPERLIRIVLHGLRGPIEVGARTYNREMPGFGGLFSDAEIAALLTFVRGRFCGAGASLPAPVTAAAVARVRAASGERTEYWTAEEIGAPPPH